MKPLFVSAALACCVFTATAQDGGITPASGRFINTAKFVFKLEAGDVLVYHVTNGKETYEYKVTVQQCCETIRYDYEAATKNVKGSESILSDVSAHATTYFAPYAKPNTPLPKNNLTFWLSKINFQELADSTETQMDFGNGKMIYAKGEARHIKFKYKGEDKTYTVFTAEAHDEEGEGKPDSEVTVLNTVANPLIFKVNNNNGWILELKEIR
jgi:hypothetical protein